MSSIVRHNTTHTQLGRTIKKTLGHDRVGLRGSLKKTSHGQDTVMNTLDDLANTSLHTGFVAQIGHILASFADDDACLLRRDDGAQSQHGLGIFFFGLGGTLDLGVVDTDPVEGVGETIVGGHWAGFTVLSSSHCCVEVFVLFRGDTKRLMWGRLVDIG